MLKYWKLALPVVAGGILSGCAPSLPDLQPASKSVWLEQNWTPEQRDWFHHASQGTATLLIPVEWFVALEQPALKVFGSPGLLSSNDYLLRVGFIESPANEYNKAGLPVGFAVDQEFKDPVTGQAMHALGYTCAACHTGHLKYKGTEIKFDGGPAVTDVTKLAKIEGYAMAYTKYVPFRFGRFADRVLGPNHTSEQEAELEKQFDAALANLKRIADLEGSVAKGSVEEGFARLDALSRIGNAVFGVAAEKPHNYHPIDAPVSYPHIWSASWFDWVQYDGSIMQPMVRNAGEALGVVAAVNLAGPKETRYASTARIKTLYEMEDQLAGPTPPTEVKRFTGLASPRWPEDILGKIDQTKAAQGKALYEQHCQGCHRPAPDTAEFWNDEYWTPPNEAGRRYLKLVEEPVDAIGTDPMQAKALADRTIDTQGIGLDTTVYVPQAGGCQPVVVKDGALVGYGAALGAVVQETVKYWYDQNQVPPADRERINGYRPNCLNAAMQYAARPLNGIWATPPYLHNASVPDMYALLSPASERPATFYLGNQEYDPVRLGYDPKPFANGFKLDTSLPGNSNRGHEFDEGPKGKGMIGPRLTPDQRWALIEYLKTL